MNLVGAVCLSPLMARQAQALPSDYVNPLRGTNSGGSYSHGNNFPASAVPFGFNFWSPMTDANSTSWIYDYTKSSIQAFTISHMPSPWMGDRQTFQVMPETGSLVVDRASRALAFTHSNETARAHSYSVLFNNGLRTEIAPTDHAASWRFTFPSTSSYLLFDTVDGLNSSISIDKANGVVSGYVDHSTGWGPAPRMYVYAKFSKAIADGANVSGQRAATSYVHFTTSPGEQVTMSIATSFISVAQAQANLTAEIGTKSFDTVKQQAQDAWNAMLGKIEVEGATEDQKTILYSNMYRAFLYPNSAWESVNGTPSYASPYASGNPVKAGKVYVNNGFWDTYRTTWPLYELLIPTKAGEMLDGFVNGYKDGGWVTRWSAPGYANIMVGTNSDVIFADAYLKGVRNFDYTSAYASMLRNATSYSSNAAQGRKGMDRSIFLGYTPQDTVGESVSWSLEGYLNDFGIAQLAQALGKTDDAQYFYNRSLNYTNLFSSSVGFFRGKNTDGSWRTADSDFKANRWGYEYTEGDAWHYCTLVPQDGQGLANLYSGRAGLSAKLDALFAAPRDYDVGSYGGVIHEMAEAYDVNMGQYGHSNQPVHHTIYMYNYAGTPWRTQQHVRDVLNNLYQSGIGTGYGYLGDEDNGEMSSWYLFGAMGFYPVSMGRPEYAIGAPFFSKMTVHLENGSNLVITAPNVSDTNRYIQSATLNGAAYTHNYLPHSALVNGATINFTMGSSASTWGSGANDVPTSQTTGSALAQPLYDVTREGGIISASADNSSSGEGIGQAFDNNSQTKWLAFQSTPWIGFQLNTARVVKQYTLTSANDFPTRDPKSWSFLASNDGSNWVTLDTRTAQDFPWRFQTRAFAINNTTAYTYYRLQVNELHGDTTTQLAEIELLGK